MSYKVDLVVGNKYHILRKIGAGSFGEVFLGINIISGDQVAVKFESIKSRHPQIIYEYRVYKTLQGGSGIPHIKWYIAFLFRFFFGCFHFCLFSSFFS